MLEAREAPPRRAPAVRSRWTGRSLCRGATGAAVHGAVLAVVLLLGGAARAETAEEQLARIGSESGGKPLDETVAALAQVAQANPGAPAAGRACVLLGDIYWRHQRSDDAERYFQQAYDGPFGGEVHALAAAALADVRLQQSRLSDALRLYDEALLTAAPLLRLELVKKRAVVGIERGRSWLHHGAWLGFAVSALILLALVRWRSVRDKPVPTELLYVLPVFIAFILACPAQSSDVGRAMRWIAGGSAILIAASGYLSATRVHPRALFAAAQTIALLVGHLSIFYIAVYREGVLDRVLTSIKWSTIH
jgi:hypothetical protein